MQIADRGRGSPDPLSAVARTKLAGKYRLVRELGRGGMGVVYQAVDAGGRVVALKVLSSALADDLVALLRFKREARTASSLSHPNICSVHEFGESRGRPFIVMELLEGMTLKDRLAQGSCDPLLVLDIVTQVAEGLGAAHTKFIVHRDIKPANIFLVTGGAVKMLDFGIAKHFVHFEADSTLYGDDPGHTPGTVDYMSPEQLLGQRVDQRSNLFALGVSLYEVLTGRTPFRARTKLATMANILQRSAPPLPAMLHREEWTQVLQRLLQKKPTNVPGRRRAAAGPCAAQAAHHRAPRRLAGATASRRPARRPVGGPRPFEVVSDEDETDERKREVKYFSHGLMDELIAALTRVDGLRVPPRTLALKSRPQPRNLARLGRRFHADFVLTGEVKAKGDRLSVTVTWFSVEDNAVLWGKRYEIAVEDLFRLRDKIVAAVMDALQLTVADTTAATARAALNRRAFHLCLKGRFFWSKRYEGGLLTARQCSKRRCARIRRRRWLTRASPIPTRSSASTASCGRATRLPSRERRSTRPCSSIHGWPKFTRRWASFDWAWNGTGRARLSVSAGRRARLGTCAGTIYLSWVHVLLGEVAEAEEQAERARTSTRSRRR